MLHKNQDGAAAVEFAIILPILMSLVFGIIEFGALFYNKQVLTNACREGARAGITGLTDTEIRDIVTKYCYDDIEKTKSKLIGLSNAIEITETDVKISKTGEDGKDLTIEIDKNYTFLFGKILNLKNEGIPLSAKTVMRMEPTIE